MDQASQPPQRLFGYNESQPRVDGQPKPTSNSQHAMPSPPPTPYVSSEAAVQHQDSESSIVSRQAGTSMPEESHLPVQAQPGRTVYPPIEKEEIESAPWKYAGYKVFSKWVASDQGFLIVRRFGALNMRVILALQDDIVQLETKLAELDNQYSQSSKFMQEDNRTNNGTLRKDPYTDRTTLLRDDLVKALQRYNSFVNEFSQLVARQPVNKEDVRAVETWLRNRDAIDDEEAAYIECKDDLIPLHPKNRSWFRKVLENTLLLRTACMKKYFCRRPSDYEVIRDYQTVWQDDKMMEGLSSGVIGFVGLIMLIAPLWWLNYVSNPAIQLGIITGFIVLFFVIISIATTARIFETLAAAAAYSAVLMVFMQIGPGRSAQAS